MVARPPSHRPWNGFVCLANRLPFVAVCLLSLRRDMATATPEELKDLDSIRGRLEEANKDLGKTVEKEHRATIQAQVTALNLEKKLIEAKIDVRNNVAGAQERVTRFQEAFDALLLPAAAPVGTFLFAVALLPCLFDCLVWLAHLSLSPSLSLHLSLSFSLSLFLSLQRHPTRRTRPHCLRRSLRSRRRQRPTCASTSRRSC